jgi:hypothetical protein
MKIKLLNRDDIRRFGGTVVDIPDHIAHGLIERWRAVRADGADTPKEQKSIMAPPMNKAMWSPPEEKAMLMAKSSTLPKEKVPKEDAPLFPKSIIA